MTILHGKVAIVTGASSGIGAGIVKELLQLEMKVVGLARRKEKVEALGKNCSGKLYALKVDVTDEQDIIGAFSWTQSNLGQIHVVINCAGIYYASKIAQAEKDGLQRVLDTNLLAVTLFTREAVKNMQANNIDGTIININSVSGHSIPSIDKIAIYAASKHGVRAFTEAIRQELAKEGSKIRISSVSPGLVESEMTTEFTVHHPYLQPEDIANGVRYILTQPSNVNVAELIIRPMLERL